MLSSHAQPGRQAGAQDGQGDRAASPHAENVLRAPRGPFLFLRVRSLGGRPWCCFSQASLWLPTLLLFPRQVRVAICPENLVKATQLVLPGPQAL